MSFANWFRQKKTPVALSRIARLRRRKVARHRRAFFEPLESRALLAIDFGDAPDSSIGTGLGNYQTLLADNGPRHDITATQNTLHLGTRVDGEADAAQNAQANGDDILPDDEDGLIEPSQDLVLTAGAAPIVRVRATNTTGVAATLYGWIDVNRDGAFDNSTERTSVAVSPATTNGLFTLTFPTIPLSTAAGATYARFRLSSDAAAADSTGAASGGEVEDYAATITKRSDGTADGAMTQKIASNTNGGPPLTNADDFGSAVAALGDLDGDGVNDLAVGSRYDNTGSTDRGAVYVLFMNANGSVKSNVKIASDTGGGPTLATNDFFGSSLASLGDLDGDGVTDLAVGTVGDNTGGTNRGAVYVLLLNADGTVKSNVKIASGTNGGPTLVNSDYFGRSVASLGDLDGDGVADLAVGANRDDTEGTNRGAVYVLLLNSSGTVKNSLKIASGLNGGPALENGDYFGVSVASLGDLNGDGVTDLAVGANRDDTGGTDRGAVHVLFMQADGTVQSSVKIASDFNGGPPLGDADEFGRAVASLGDLDGDGLTDLASGAFRDDTGGTNRGAMHVLFMNSNGSVKRSIKFASGISESPTLADNDQFGIALAPVGDLNGDGVIDLAIGANGDDTEGSGRGAVQVLFLNPPRDFGDAPDAIAGTGTGNYQTRSADNGPRHDITTTQTTLFLGARVDGETDATPSALANGDDITTSPPDENGLVEPAQDLLLTVGSVPTVRVRATNMTGAAATLYGWIDVNRDGVFDNSTERTSVAVSPATTNGLFTLTFPTIPLSSAAGATYARFRLSSDVAVANSTGLASGGEVEDYPATITQRSDGTADSAKNRKIASGVNGGPMLTDSNYFGSAVASLGDLDGDGVTDLAVGAYRDATGGHDRGAVHVLFMNANGTVKSTVKLASGTSGGPLLVNNDYFGYSVASLGDLDGDGVTDLAVGALNDDTGDSSYDTADRGAVYVLLLNANGTVKSSVKLASGTNGGPDLVNRDRFGSSVASLGDLDGDGVTDLVAGASGDSTEGMYSGAVYVLFMNLNGTVKSSVKIANGSNGGPALLEYAEFGGSVASLGDLDGDGVTDLAVGAVFDHREEGFRGAAYALLMNANGTVKSSVRIASDINGGPSLPNFASFGRSMASLGDLDGDGVTELAVGAFRDNTGGFTRGAMHVLFFNADGTVKKNIKIASDINGGPMLGNYDHFGTSIASLGDLDGDGLTDLAVGAIGDDTGGGPFANRGAVHVLFLKTLVSTDFGDAPDSGQGTGTSNYQTLAADNGPYHDIEMTHAKLYLGARVDGEFDAVPNSRANSDDSSTSPNDEDGLVEPAQDLLFTVGSSPTVRVRATNATDSTATLYGWIDYNRDGVFDNATERTSASVPTGTDNGTFTLAFPTIPIGTSAGPTYARFRLSTDIAAANPTGSAIGGEIEDYAASITLRSDGTANIAKTKKIASDINGGPTLGSYEYYGRSVAPLGDLDRDGVTDIAVGAFRRDENSANSLPGVLYVQYMNPDGSVKSSVAIGKNINGGPNLDDRDFFATSIAAIGDMDGDGITELAVGAARDNTGSMESGALYVMFLNSNGTVKHHVKIASETNGGPQLTSYGNFGRSIAALGDLDGDGVNDIAVGAFADNVDGSDRGAVYVLYLNGDGTVKRHARISSTFNGGPALADGDFFGLSLASLGDLDGDGVTDLAVGAGGDDTGTSYGGAVHVLFLNADASVKNSVKIASAMNGGPTLLERDLFGLSVASLGDLNGDGLPDLAVGAPGDDGGAEANVFEGVVHVLFLGQDGKATGSVKIGNGRNGGPTLDSRDSFGFSVASLGDLDGDGLTDIAVGSYRDSTSETYSGAVHVLFLKPPNQAPSFAKGDDLSATDEDPAQEFSDWATDISAGPPDESGQTLNFLVTNDNNALFLIQPGIDAVTGDLTFTPKPNMHGVAMVTVTLKDDGGTVQGGVDISSVQQFSITVTKPHPLFNATESGARRGLDVTGSTTAAPDGSIVAGDVLAVINYINSKGSGAVPHNTPFGPPYPDVNGDNQVVAGDVIAVINYINARSSSEAEAAAALPDLFFANLAGTDEPAETELNLPTALSRGTLADVMAILAMDAVATQSKRRRLFA